MKKKKKKIHIVDYNKKTTENRVRGNRRTIKREPYPVVYKILYVHN